MNRDGGSNNIMSDVDLRHRGSPLPSKNQKDFNRKGQKESLQSSPTEALLRELRGS